MIITVADKEQYDNISCRKSLTENADYTIPHRAALRN
jgi:hypothetical protein